MKFIVAVATLVSLLPATLGLNITTPYSAVVVQCQPVLLTWFGGTPPYYVFLIPDRQIAAPALETFPTQNGNQLTWVVDQPQGTNFTLAVKDSTGAVAYSDIVTVQPSSDKSCIGGSSNVNPSPTNTASGSPSNLSPVSGSGGSPTGRSPTSIAVGASGSAGDATGLSLSGFSIAGVIGAIAVLF
ncbi:hypothetical protein BJ322DRAFT_420232 [Thelephora terrestris]|uniref:Ser-Thr-rich glycosyl-phosphatidyl-inositol-anchored membrane family-domain-containing protein n=1 Tax=Thelephora terrestris TaxID=56493 RepID=A0A9P6LBC5_9AGAM|nr:hypothetical protein BJ322DRAFT_420232 [Thelephora terrestris]